MALPVSRRRFMPGYYFGDGRYPTAPQSFVLTDRATGTMYRVTAPSGVLTLVEISALAVTDVREDFMSVLDTTSNVYLNAYVSNGSLLTEETKSLSRPAYVQDGNTRYLVKRQNSALTAVEV